MATVGLADGAVERLVMDVVHARAVVRAVEYVEANPRLTSLVEELPRLLPVDDAGERVYWRGTHTPECSMTVTRNRA